MQRFGTILLAVLIWLTTAPASVQSSEETPLNLVPYPHEVTLNEGALALHGELRVFLMEDAERPEHLAALLLVDVLRDATDSTRVQLDRPALNQEPPTGSVVLRVTDSVPDDPREAQGYTLTVNADGVSVTGNSAAGLYYGIQTLTQMVEFGDGNTLPHLEIRDVPDFEWRGFYHDISRGKVPTLDTMKEIVDYIAERKMNMFQLYVEHPFLFRFDPEIAQNEDGLTHQEVLELQEYCRDRRVLLVPSLQSFGHMGGVLSLDRYRHLADVELEKDWDDLTWHERMVGATIDMNSDEARALLTTMHEEYNALHDAPFSNVCADETYALGEGKNKELAEERGKGRLYLDHIEWLNELTKSHDKRMMFWGDIVKQHPDLVPEIPKDTILLNWGYYRTTDYESTRLFQEAGLDFFVCPGTSGWNRILNAINNADINIRTYAETGKKYGAMGLLNTDWGDHGHYNLLGASMHGIALGAAMAWNTEAPDTERFNRIWNLQTFGVDESDGVDALFALSPWADDTGTWIQLYRNFSADVFATLEGEGADELERLASEAENVFLRYEQNEAGDVQTIRELIHATQALQLLAEKGRLVHDLRLDERPLGLAERLLAWADQLEELQADYDELWLERNKPSELFKIQEAIAEVATEARSIAGGINE